MCPILAHFLRMNGRRMHSARQGSSPTIKIVPQVLPNSRMGSSTTYIHQAPAPLRLWHLASLDAPTVALVWSTAFAWAAHVFLPLWIPAPLVLAVWSVYVTDRLLDARAALRNATLNRLRERHFFHWRHRRVFLPLAAAAAAASAYIVLTLMPPIVRERNSILAAASLVYFTRVHTGGKLSPLLPKLFSKEFLVGVLFTAGCALPALSRVTIPTTAPLWPLLIAVAFFAFLAWLNCLAIDRWESSPDSTCRLSIAPLAAVIALVGLVLTAIFAAILPAAARSSALLLAASAAALLLALLDRRRANLSPTSLRAAADLVLLTPALLIPFAPLFK